MSRLTRTAARLGLLARSETSSPLPGVVPPRRTAAPTTTPSQALTLDAVYRCVTVIQTAAKQLSLDVWRGQVRLEGADLPRLVTHPGPALTPTALISETVASLALRGNAYWLIARDGDGRASALRVLDPMECTPRIERTTGERTVRWRDRTWTPDQLRHLRLTCIPGEAEGLGPIQACQSAITGAIQLHRYAQGWIDGSGVPTGVLSTDQPITREQAQEAKARWNESNSPGQGVAVIGNGLHYSPLALKPSEVQFLETRAFDVLAVGRMFGVPAHMLLASVDGSSMTYQNVTDAATDFVRWTVMGYLREIEDAMSSVLPRGTTTRFNLDALLRADTATRMSSHATAISAGIYSPQWARQIEGIPQTQPQEQEQ